MLVVLTGVRGAGKSTVLSKISELGLGEVLQPSTTRPPRAKSDHEYDFVSEWVGDRYAWTIDVGGHKYGMRRSEVEKAETKLCFTQFEPLSIETLREAHRERTAPEAFVVGLDTLETLELQHERVGHAEARMMQGDTFEQARKVVRLSDVVLRRGSVEEIVEGVRAALKVFNSRGGVLVESDIRPLMSAGCLVEEATSANIRSASYDLRIGDQVWCQGRLLKLSDESPDFSIPPYSYAIVTAAEWASLPTFVTGTFDVKVSLFLNGVILSNGPQVDPGYRGQLFCMLFNGSSISRPLERGIHFATIQFCTTTSKTSPYNAQYQLQSKLREIMGEGTLGGPGGDIQTKIGEIDESVRSLKRNNTAFLGVIVGIAVTAIVVFVEVTMAGYWARITDLQADLRTIRSAVDEMPEAINNALDAAILQIEQAEGEALAVIDAATPTQDEGTLP